MRDFFFLAVAQYFNDEVRTSITHSSGPATVVVVSLTAISNFSRQPIINNHILSQVSVNLRLLFTTTVVVVASSWWHLSLGN